MPELDRMRVESFNYESTGTPMPSRCLDVSGLKSDVWMGALANKSAPRNKGERQRPLKAIADGHIGQHGANKPAATGHMTEDTPPIHPPARIDLGGIPEFDKPTT